MDRDVLQVFTAAFISELDMEKSRKMDLLEYVAVANKSDLLYYLATGSIATGIIQESEMLSYTESVIEGLIYEAPASRADILKRQAQQKVDSVVHRAKGLFGNRNQDVKSIKHTQQQDSGENNAERNQILKSQTPGGGVPSKMSNFRKNAGEKFTRGKEAVKTFAGSKTGKGVGIAIAVAAAVAASYIAYKRFFSQGAKACKDAADRKGCLQQYKKKAAMAKAAALQAGMSKCASSSNPEKCKASLASKVAKAKAEAAAIG